MKNNCFFLLVIALGLALAPQVVAFGRTGKPDYYEKTLQTKFPAKNGWFFYATASNPRNDFWFYDKDFNPKDRIITTWIRNYDYSQGIVTVSRRRINRDKKETQDLNYTIYDLKTGSIIFNNENLKEEWRASMPETVTYAIYEKLDMLEEMMDWKEKHRDKK